MQRREFIKRLIGVDFKTLLILSGVLLIVYVLFSADFTNTPGTILAMLKVAAYLVIGFLLFLIAAILISIFLRQFLKILPGKLTAWLKRHGQKILFAMVTILLAYFIYDSIKKEKYFTLVFMILYFGLYFLFRDKEKIDKVQ